MLTSGDVVNIDLGSPLGREAGFRRPAVIVTAQALLSKAPSIVHVVPLTSTLRGFSSEISLQPDDTNGLDHPSAAQCQHIRAVATGRLGDGRGNIGAGLLAQIRDVVALILDIAA